MIRSSVAVRRFSVVLALMAVAAVLASSGGATPPPPPPIAAGNHPWIVVLCKFTDLSTEPSTYTPSYFGQLFAGTGSSSLDLTDWWSEISYNAINIAGTQVTTQWYSLGTTRYEWAGLNRYDKIRTCANVSATDANIGNDFSKYYGVIAVFNDDSAVRPAATTLAGALNASATTLTVASSAAFPAPPFAVTIDDGTPNNLEELHVTGVSGTTWTVSRNYENFNPAAAHANGTAVNLMDGGDLGAADTGTHGITINAKNYNLGLVVLPPQTNLGAAQHETGHGFGYSHSRKLSTSTTDYNDCYDIMSFDSCNKNFTGDFGAAGVLNDPLPAAVGPGLNAIELDVQGWMPAGRTFNYSNGSCSQTTRTVAALNHPEASGDMEIRVPAALTIPIPGSATTTSDYYTIELRDKTLWDRGIPQNTVMLHLHGLDGFSYWVDGAGHAGAMYLADEYVDGPNNVVVTVNRMDTAAHTATVAIAAGGTGGGCKLNANVAYSGATTSDFNDMTTLAADVTVAGGSVPVPSVPVMLSLGTQSCPATTDANGHASCVFTVGQHPGSYTATAAFAGDTAYNPATGTSGFTITNEESAVAYTGALTQDYHDPFTASATLVDPDGGAPIAGKPIVFTLGAGDTCTATTDGSGVASCPITPNQAAGTVSISAAFGPDVDYVSSSAAKPFAITREETTTTYTGPVVIAQGNPVTLRGRLLEDGVVPIAGRTLTLTLGSGAGSQSCVTGPTDAAGDGQCTIASVTVAQGPQPLRADFLGDGFYLPSNDASKTAIVFAFPSRGVFVLGDRTVATAGSSTLTYWGADWSSLNVLSGGDAPAAFKGFAGTPSSRPPACGGTWTSRPGDSPPPVGAVPDYMGTAVASSVTKSGSTVSGTIATIVVVITTPGYAPNPGHPGRGTIVATYC